MPSSTRTISPAPTETSAPVDLAAASHPSLSQAVHARRSEFTRPHQTRIKVGTWNVAACPGTDKDLSSWFVEGKGLDAQLANLDIGDRRGQDEETGRDGPHPGHETEPIQLVDGDKYGLYVLGLQEVVNLNISASLYSTDPSLIDKWQLAIEAALPPGYVLVASHQLTGLLLLIYASPEIAPTVSNVSTISVGTGVFGYMGNKGAVSSRIMLGETTRLVFTNSHLASGHDSTTLDRRCWDYAKISSSTTFAPVSYSGISEDEGDKLGEEDFGFWFGDLNFRLDDLPGDDIRRLLMLHTSGEYYLNKRESAARLDEDGVVIMKDTEDNDSVSSDGGHPPSVVSRESSFDRDYGGEGSDDDTTSLPDPDEFSPNPHDDPASLQATLDSLLPHDQLHRVIKARKAFHEGWREGQISFLPSYKYDVGTVGLFDSSEKRRAPSWCDRILYRTRKDVNEYKAKLHEEAEARKKDDEMRKRGIDQAAEDENVLFDYDPTADAETQAPAKDSQAGVGGAGDYEYDEYDEGDDDDADLVISRDELTEDLSLDVYTSHQRITSSDHKPIVAIFTLNYDAIVPELKAKVHAEVARELDRAENEGRPDITLVVDAKDSRQSIDSQTRDDGRGGVNFGAVGFLRLVQHSLTIANTGQVPATFSFVEKSHAEGEDPSENWLNARFMRSPDDPLTSEEKEVTLDPGDTLNILLSVQATSIALCRALNDSDAQLEDVLVLRVKDGRDHFIPVRATWVPTCFGRSIEELIRLPKGGIRAMEKTREKGGSISYSLDVRHSSPAELYKLTEAIEALMERVLADESMVDDCKAPRDQPGWPFEVKSDGEDSDLDAKAAEQKLALISALEEDRPLLDSLNPQSPTVTKLEIVASILVLFLQSLTDGIVTAQLFAKIETALPSLGNAPSTKSADALEDERSAVLDILSQAPYHNISFVFVTSMLNKMANELLPASAAPPAPINSGVAAVAGITRGLSFRRRPTLGAKGGATQEQDAALQKRLAWERKTAEILGPAICRGGLPSNAKERKTTDERMRGVVEVFLRRDRVG